MRARNRYTGTSDSERSVFVNCPFDPDYRPFLYAMVFTIFRSGFLVRSALEADNAADNRFDKICRIIDDCRCGVHDISRTELNGDPPLPRFNMPLELGLFLGARKFGGSRHRTKACIIFDRDKLRYQKFISDIAGQDIHTHRGSVATLIIELAAWLRLQSGQRNIPGAQAINAEFGIFCVKLPDILSERKLDPEEITFGDYSRIVAEYLAALPRDISS